MIKTVLLLLILPLAIVSIKKAVDLRKGASGIPANIIIDAKNTQGNIQPNLWQNLSQGGEEPLDMIKPAIPLLRSISPKLIRIDHIFDYYKVDKGNNNYDFSQLDEAVNSILLTGAKPMLSVSYTPDSKAPADWNQWYQLVKATAKHYSIDKKIDGIYYEVWNEPDLFGGWHYAKDPNYTTLYSQTSKAIVEGAKGSNFKIGGPATTAYYSNWIKSIFTTTSSNNLRLDFISWHKYSKNIEDYEKDLEDFNNIISNYPQYFDVERIISEVGPNSDPDTWYENKNSGVHLISLVTKISGKVHRLFTFEPIDGPSPRSSVSSGWGIISHDLKPKPRFYAIQFLNNFSGTQLSSTGNGSWVSSLASIKSNTIQVLLVNYDSRDEHSETFPITINNLTPGNYQIKKTSYLGKSLTIKKTLESTFQDSIYMEPNSAIILEIQPI